MNSTLLESFRQPRVRQPVAREGESFWLRIDYVFVLAVFLLGCFGIAMIYSSSRGPDPEQYNRLNSDRQAIFLAVGMVLMLAVAWIRSDRFRQASWVFYGVGLTVLLLVISPLGASRRGAQAWFEISSFQIQPSEFMKVAFVMALASFLSSGDSKLQVPRLLAGLAIVLVPIGLVMLEPDAGTSVVFVVIAMAMIVVRGVRLRHALVLLVCSAVAVGLLLSSSILEEYQRERLNVFINPDTETIDTYNVEQAQIAIGNGGLFGQGYGQGSQTQSGRVPEQHTDFIFTAVGEELGFMGAAGTVLVYALLLWRIARLGRASSTTYGKLLATGVLAMLAFQGFQAAGMAVGIMPVTGVPFPLLSYGGSSMLATCLALGLVLGLGQGREENFNPAFIR